MLSEDVNDTNGKGRLMAEYMIVNVDDVLDCCKIITALGDGVELRRTVTPEERAS